MNTPSKIEQMPALAINEQELLKVLENSLYPGAQQESIKLVISYCKASGLDPMQKPVHIVPIWDSKNGRMRDVVMPGIGLYRTQASRSGQYAGVSDPEFGPSVTKSFGGQEITFPAWCRVTVQRLLASGQMAEFSASERWEENYAAKGGKEKSVAPNAMWARRPFAQLAKCAEAQALRKAFPELGAAPTADEMEGKEIDMGSAERVEDQPPTSAGLPGYPQEQFDANVDKWRASIAAGKKTPEALIAMIGSKYSLSAAQKEGILDLAQPAAEEPQQEENDFVSAYAEAEQ